MNKEIMQKIELLKKEAENLGKEQLAVIEANRELVNSLATDEKGQRAWFKQNIEPLREREMEIERVILPRLEQQALEVGDGVTICLYTDCHAYTIIRRTAKTATIRRCKATLNREKSHLEFTPGGFLGHTEGEQVYDYEEDPKGHIAIIRWSEARGCFLYKGERVQIGRHEFYDYNF